MKSKIRRKIFKKNEIKFNEKKILIKSSCVLCLFVKSFLRGEKKNERKMFKTFLKIVEFFETLKILNVKDFFKQNIWFWRICWKTWDLKKTNFKVKNKKKNQKRFAIKKSFKLKFFSLNCTKIKLKKKKFLKQKNEKSIL